MKPLAAQFQRRSTGIVAAVALCAVFAAAVPLPAAGPAAAKLTPLQTYARGAMEARSPADRRRLEQFAVRNAPAGKDPAQAALAYLALGYSHLLQGNHAAAHGAFTAAQTAANPLRDYADFYSAMAAQAQSKPLEAATLLAAFQSRNPSSPLAPRAALEHAKLLIELQRPQDAAMRLEEAVGLPQPAATFFLARAYELSGRAAEAAGTYQQVFFGYPLSAEAVEASTRLQELRLKMAGQYPVPPATLWQQRADALFHRSRWKEAETAYRSLAAAASEPAVREHASVRVAVSQYQAGATWPALNALAAMRLSDAAADAERLYIQSIGYRKLQRITQMREYLEQLGRKHPASPWYEKALISAGNNYLLERDYTRAGDYYRLAFQNFPGGEGAALGHWKVAWQAYRERRLPEARHLFEEHITAFPKSPQVSAALYWLARILEKESKPVAARYYQKLREAYPNYYYALLAGERLAELPAFSAEQLAAARTIPLEGVQRSAVSLRPERLAPVETRAGERVRLLESAWLLEWAIAELQPMLPPAAGASWAGAEMARIEELRGRHHVALRLSKLYVPGYFSQNITDLPPDVWRRLFPVPYWDQIQARAAEARLDPYLVAGLIRQESEFNPEARSRSNARGLMQLLPSTAKLVARQAPDARARSYSLGLLFQPQFNLLYGTMYLRSVLDRFDGSLEKAIASYNAGPGRVKQWLDNGAYEEPAEFVESIPFTETREYVQAVLRNAQMYRQIYATPAN